MQVRVSSGAAPGAPGILILVFLILCGAVVAPAGARYTTPEGSNAGINPGDTIFNGEQKLNFSALQPSPPLLPPLKLAHDDGVVPGGVGVQELEDGAVLKDPLDVPEQYHRRLFKLRNETTWGDATTTVLDSPTGTIVVRAGRELGADENPTDKTPTVIPANLNIQFKLDPTNLNSGNFTGAWYEWELIAPSRSLHTVKNMAGDSVSLEKLAGNPSADNNTLAFSIADQSLNPDEGAYTMIFRAYNEINNRKENIYTTTYPFTVVRYRLAMSASPETVEPDQTTTLTITGTPYTHYTIVIDDDRDGKPEFPSTGTYDIYTDKHNVTVHPDWSGTVSVPLYIPVPTGDASHTTSIYYPKVYETKNPSTSATAKVVVEPGRTQGIELYEIELGLDEFFSLGDTIEINGTLGKPAKDTMKLYFYLIGPNLNANGVKPSNPRIPVVDGDNSTFDFITLSKDQSEFIYPWDTSAAASLEPGTYTIFATLDPVGYNQRELSETGTKDYVVIDLNDPSINVMFPKEAPGFFAQGDHIVSLWTARGSPEKVNGNGKIRYYIFGSNLQYTGIREFPLAKLGAFRKDLPGYSGLNLPRSFSANLTEGEYTVVYQHPMYNGKFDLRPVEGDAYNGAITTLTTPEGPVSLSGLQAPDALRALKAALAPASIDDSLVIQTFAIEKPSVDIAPILNYEVGESIPVTGTTNLECPMEYEYNQLDLPGDPITLSVYTADMYYAGKTQSVNRVYSEEAYPAKTATGAASRTISFAIPEKASAQMKPGDYAAILRCEDIKYEKTFFFTLHETGYRKEHGLADPVIGEGLSTVPVATPWTTEYAPTPRTTNYVPTPFAIPTTEASSGLSLGYGSAFSLFSVLGIFCTLLYAMRRR